MSIRFAAAGSGECAVVARMLRGAPTAPAANDTDAPLGRDQLLRAALLHFAEHGLAAAERAHERATAAFFADDRLEYHHWMGICRMLDRRRAGESPDRALRQG
jgi:hypothetical protein